MDLTIDSAVSVGAWNDGGNSSVRPVELATGVAVPATGVADISRHAGAIRSAVIVVNDAAPGARDANWKALFSKVLGPEVEITEVHASHFEGVTSAARGAVAWGTELIIAVGGDGTVNACVNGIGDARTKLAVVPAGTANDLSRLACHAVNPACSDAATWERRDIDAISVTASGADDGVRFYSAGGVGWVADVADAANRWRSGGRWPAFGAIRRKLLALIGPVIYTLAVLRVILFSRRLGARFKVTYTDASDGSEKKLDFDGYGMLVANCNRVGKSFHLAPVSKIDDGVFELIVFPRTSRRRLLKAALLAQSKKLFELPEVFWIQATRAHIELDREQSFFGDGEVLSRSDEFAVELAANPVRLVVPPVVESVSREVARDGGLDADDLNVYRSKAA